MMLVVEWFLAPISGATHHSLEPWTYWHARCMVLGWGVLIPVGALVARYFKITARQRWPQELDNKMWWHGHRTLQWMGVLIVSVGGALAWDRSHGTGMFATAHAVGGWILVGVAWMQVAAGLARGSKGGPTDVQLEGDHYDMTPHRIWFERLHKFAGWLAILAGPVIIVLGLYLADAPRWMLAALALWWLALAATAWHWQRIGRCVDTYQAIWGPDTKHPGNRRQPIGWGVRRPSI